MGGCGERCFSRYVLRLTADRPLLFGRLIGILVYSLALGIVTMTHKGALQYFYYKFLEYHDVDPVPQMWLDAIPSYVTPVYVILLLVALPFMLCACCGVGCKVRNIVHWVLALFFGALFSSLLSYTAQIILYVIRLFTMFLDNKVFTIAVCYCTMTSGSGSLTTESYGITTRIGTTQNSLTSQSTTTMLLPESTTPNEYTTDAPAEFTTDTDISTDLPNDNISDFTIMVQDDAQFWCQCKVPFENFPISVTTRDPEDIDDDYLYKFGVEDYTGDVGSVVVNSTAQVKEMTDAELSEYKLFLSLLQGLVIILALRVPLWLVLNNIWSHVELLEARTKWGLERTRHSRLSRQSSRIGFGSKLGHFMSRSAGYLDAPKFTSRESSAIYEASSGTTDADKMESLTYDAGVQNGIRKSRQLPIPPHTVVPALGPLFYCLLETIDAFSLLDEILYRPHYFKADTILRILTLTVVGISMAAVMVVNFLIVIPNTRTGKGYHVTRFLFIILTNGGFLYVRIALLIQYELFNRTLVSSTFISFIAKEAVLIIYITIEFGMGIFALRKREHERHRAEVLGRWRDYKEGIQSDKTGAVWVSMSRRGTRTTDTASNTDDGVSSSGDIDDLPVYSARNENYSQHENYAARHEYPTPFRRNFRYMSNEGPVQGDSYGLTNRESDIDFDYMYQNSNAQETGGFGTFTRKASKRKSNQERLIPDVQSSSKTQKKPIDLSAHLNGEGIYLGPELLMNESSTDTFTRSESRQRNSRRENPEIDLTVKSGRAYTDKERAGMIFYI